VQSGADKLTQARHGRRAFLGRRSRSGERGKKRPKRIHGPAFFLDGQEWNGRRGARQLDKEFLRGFGSAGKRRVYHNAARIQTAKQAFE
jgi:hypothetical protein